MKISSRNSWSTFNSKEKILRNKKKRTKMKKRKMEMRMKKKAKKRRKKWKLSEGNKRVS